jgi:hypothetical protein
MIDLRRYLGQLARGEYYCGPDFGRGVDPGMESAAETVVRLADSLTSVIFRLRAWAAHVQADVEKQSPVQAALIKDAAPGAP